MNAIKTDRNSDYNFIKQLAVYAGVTAFFALLAAGTGMFDWNLGNANQMLILVNLMLSLGFLVYLSQSGCRLNRSPRINDKAALSWVCLPAENMCSGPLLALA